MLEKWCEEERVGRRALGRGNKTDKEKMREKRDGLFLYVQKATKSFMSATSFLRI